MFSGSHLGDTGQDEGCQTGFERQFTPVSPSAGPRGAEGGRRAVRAQGQEPGPPSAPRGCRDEACVPTGTGGSAPGSPAPRWGGRDRLPGTHPSRAQDAASLEEGTRAPLSAPPAGGSPQ